MIKKLTSILSFATIAVFSVPLAQAAAVGSGDRVAVPLSDPARPAFVKAHLLNGSIAVKSYEGKEVIVEAKARSGDEDRERESGGAGMHRIPINSTGLEVEEESNRVNVGAASTQRAIDLTISVPVHSSLSLHTVNDGDIDVTFPAELKANLIISSDRGDVFSDFDVAMAARAPQQVAQDGRSSDGSYHVKIDKTVRGTING